MWTWLKRQYRFEYPKKLSLYRYIVSIVDFDTR